LHIDKGGLVGPRLTAIAPISGWRAYCRGKDARERTYYNVSHFNLSISFYQFLGVFPTLCIPGSLAVLL
jgi:hypothetical protein